MEHQFLLSNALMKLLILLINSLHLIEISMRKTLFFTAGFGPGKIKYVIYKQSHHVLRNIYIYDYSLYMYIVKIRIHSMFVLYK